MLNSGFNVPPGFVVSTDAYRVFLETNHIEISRELNADKVRTSIERAKVPSEVSDAIIDAYAKLGGGKVAVRSSATAEDLPQASFAGQYETYLNIEGKDELLKHVKQCFASNWTDRAISYRDENNIDYNQVQIAVVVQAMVPARCAGVLFTQNPMSTRKSEMMIESNFGLGESVVSGQTAPDRFVVDAVNDEFTLLSREIGAKDLIIEGIDDGVQRVELSYEKSQQTSLDDEEIIKLSKVAKSIECVFNSPQDIEWAIDCDGVIHILQSRPITSKSRKDSDQIFWTRGYADDYWNDPVSPLFYDLLGDQINFIVNVEANAIMGYKDLPDQLLKLHKGHVYFNLDVLRTKVVNEMPPFIRSEDVLNYFPDGSGPYGKETMRALPFALPTRIMAEIRIMLFDPDGGMSKTNDSYIKWTEETFNPYCMQFDRELDNAKKRKSIEDLMTLADELDKTMMTHFRMVRYGLPVHTLGMNLITNYLCRRWLGEKNGCIMYPILLSGLKHKTTETNNRIFDLAKQAISVDEVKQIFNGISNDVYSNLQESESPTVKSFLDEFNKFLDDFGDRGFSREVYYPRWRDEPVYVIDALKPLVSEGMRDLTEAEDTLTQKRAKAEKAVENHIRRQRYGPIKWMLFSAILGMARTYIGFRENQRFNLDRWITRNRQVFLEIGGLLVEKQYLENPSHIFFLHRKEVRAVVRSATGLQSPEYFRKLAKSRFDEFKKYENILPPKFMVGSREFDDPLPDSAMGHLGIPASQGIITGRVRVLETIEDIPTVKSGEILIVPRTDPGWTPVFSKIGGLITESGGVLSHGAVVSREFGIPAVTNVRSACQTFKTGQKVVLDGNKGVVILQPSE